MLQQIMIVTNITVYKNSITLIHKHTKIQIHIKFRHTQMHAS